VAGRIGTVLAYFRRADPRGAPPSGWALAFDAAVAVGTAAGAVYEMTQRDLSRVVVLPGSGRAGQIVLQGQAPLVQPGHLVLAGQGHASLALLAAAAFTALPLAWRRLYPIVVWLVVIAAIVAVHAAYVPPVALGTAVYAAYSAITHSRYRNLAIAVVSVTTIATAARLGDVLPRFPGRLTAIFAILLATAAGLGIRELRRRLADSTARLRRAADEAAVATELALVAERARIASELHDVVTHNVSVMIVQAGAARKIMASSPADAEDALLAVEATGREAMTELRNLLGLLSPPADGGDEATDQVGGHPAGAGGRDVAGAARAGAVSGAVTNTGAVAGGRRPPAMLRPQPGLGELDTLIGRVATAGLPVGLTVSGSPRPLPPGADLAAYRVVQEGLTNVLRHAGGATASVGVRWGETLEITVSDDGAGRPADRDEAGAGRGLLGLRERLALYGGDLAAGSCPGGGWRVRAVIPLPGPAVPDGAAPGASGAAAPGGGG
jgi:signal transduction histidine kinase